MIVIVDYGLGNIFSVVNAFEAIGCPVYVSNKNEDLQKAEGIVLPGVGAFGDGIKNLKNLGLVDTLHEQVIDNGKPFLGICLGMQLMARDSYEGDYHEGLRWLPASVKKLVVNDPNLKLPHMGWNEINIKLKDPLFLGIEGDFNFYFVHSYHMVCDDPKIISATCNYGIEFTAAVQSDNIFGMQFHPEKSHKNGLQLLRNFVNYTISEKKE
jgi:glutamine amidotransferase